MNEATIQRIIDVKPVENSDYLDVIRVLGWAVVTRRNEYKVGDLCIYVSLDTILPEWPEFEFLRKDKFRIRSKKLRGQISQGVVFPLSILENITSFNLYIEEGLDVSSVINAIHYEKPIPVEIRGYIKGCFPAYIPKTDEVRIQSQPEMLDEVRGKDVYISCKMDGTSFTCSYLNNIDNTSSDVSFSDFMKNEEFNVCSRNNALKIEGNDDNIYVIMSKKYDLLTKMRNYKLYYNKSIAIQAELCGPGIQKNRIGLDTHKLYVFNIYFIDEQRYGNYDEVVEICDLFELEMVPILKIFTITNETIDNLLKMAEGKYENTKNDREGIVIRPLEEMKYKNGRLSFKVLNNTYLLKNGE